jgi:predicted MFS family arabinose efflux permease
VVLLQGHRRGAELIVEGRSATTNGEAVSKVRTRIGVDSAFFVLEALNSLGAVYFNYYIFFFLQRHFGFGNVGNLTFSAVNGFVYIFSAWYGGKFAQRKGNLRAVLLGLCVTVASLLVASQWQTIPGQVTMMVCWTIGMCFTWPALEAQISENRPRRSLPRMIGIYNIVWAGTGALAYFWGGAIFERLGEKSLFYLPAGVHSLQIILLLFLRNKIPSSSTEPLLSEAVHALDHRPVSESEARSFLRMGWFANPFAYIAINTVIPMIPEIARKLHLSPTFAGFFCSIWFFVRLATFWFLWHWTAWHYRFGLLLGAFVALVSSFAVILLFPHLTALIAAQIVFGFAVGLIYYSSLFYSMDVGHTKGEHGGIHEAAIGLGIFAGPAVGAVALRVFPQAPYSAAWAVTGLLLLGLIALIAMRKRSKAR